MLFKNLVTVFGIASLVSAVSFAGPGERPAEKGSEGSKIEEGKDGHIKSPVDKAEKDAREVEKAGGGQVTDFDAGKGQGALATPGAKVELGKKSKKSRAKDQLKTMKEVSDQALDNQKNGTEAKGARTTSYEAVKSKNNGVILKAIESDLGTVVADRLAALTAEAQQYGLSKVEADKVFSQIYDFSLAGTKALSRAEQVIRDAEKNPKKANTEAVKLAKKMDKDFFAKGIVNGSKLVRYEFENPETKAKEVVIDTLAGEGTGRACLGMKPEAVYKLFGVFERAAKENDADKMIDAGRDFFKEEFKGQTEDESLMRMCALASSGCKLFGKSLMKACDMRMAARM